MKVSIITPFYEGDKYMQDLVTCIINNKSNLCDGDELEFILVNDSPWKKLEIPAGASTESFAKVITNDENSGIHASRVAGLNASTGDYIMFLDQDDILKDDAIATHLKHIKSIADAASKEASESGIVSVSNAVLEQKDRNLLNWYRTDYHKACVSDLKTYLNVGIQIVSPGQCLIEKRLIPDFWKEHVMSVNGADDYYLWILLLLNGVSFQVMDEPLYIHKYTGENISADTKNTDESTYEFLEILGENEAVPQEVIFALLEMISFKAAFREASKFGKLAVGLSHPKLLFENIKYKRKTKTPLGFNR